MRTSAPPARTILVVVVALTSACPAVPDPRTPDRARVASSDDGVGAAPRGSGGGSAEGSGEPLPAGLGMRTGADGGAPAEASPRAAVPATTLTPPWKGGASAKVVIEEFSDFECPYCQAGARTVEKVLKHYGEKIKVVFRHLPLRMHPQARIAAEAAVCAQVQGKFWPMHDLLFKHNDALSRADLIRYARQLGLDVPRFIRDLDGGVGKARVDADLALATERGIEGTPCFFVNGTKEEGALKLERFKELVDAELKR